MEKEFIPHEEAYALRELGFKEPSIARYATLKGDAWIITIGQRYEFSNYHESTKACVAPLWQQVFDWFEQKHSIYIDRTVITTPNEILGFEYRLKSFRFAPITVEFEELYDEFDKYKSKLACLRKLIEIVKEN